MPECSWWIEGTRRGLALQREAEQDVPKASLAENCSSCHHQGSRQELPTIATINHGPPPAQAPWQWHLCYGGKAQFLLRIKAGLNPSQGCPQGRISQQHTGKLHYSSSWFPCRGKNNANLKYTLNSKQSPMGTLVRMWLFWGSYYRENTFNLYK